MRVDSLISPTPDVSPMIVSRHDTWSDRNRIDDRGGIGLRFAVMAHGQNPLNW